MNDYLFILLAKRNVHTLRSSQGTEWNKMEFNKNIRQYKGI